MKVTFQSYWRMPEALWRRFQRLIPKWHPSPKGGRPPLDARRVADGIYYGSSGRTVRGLREKGHADSDWSYINSSDSERSACPRVCCITPAASAATR